MGVAAKQEVRKRPPRASVDKFLENMFFGLVGKVDVGWIL